MNTSVKKIALSYPNEPTNLPRMVVLTLFVAGSIGFFLMAYDIFNKYYLGDLFLEVGNKLNSDLFEWAGQFLSY
ncbi:MAG TPA: hypothetical protein EYH38_12260 [Leucothrix sp.]|nr:hypothetical protein [Leucothrix sp.]